MYVDPKGRFYKSRDYYQAFLFARMEDMWEFAETIHKRMAVPRLPRHYGGLTIGYKTKDRNYLANGQKGLCGVILLGDHHCHINGLIAHEMTHAANYYCLPHVSSKRRLGAYPDEKVAHIVGELVRQYWDKWWRLKETGKIKQVRSKGAKRAA
jgi:hypothetical protein